MIFWGHNGFALLNNKEFYITEKFDWVTCKDILIKKTDNPKYVYLKLDFLNEHIDEIMAIENQFILVSGSGDASPQICNKNNYNKLINKKNLIHWYAENVAYYHPKMTPLTVGLANHSESYEKLILNIRKKGKVRKNIIFCCFRKTLYNVNGYEYVQRDKCINFIINNKVDFYDDLDIETFLKTLNKYKFAFLPVGNGFDYAPKIWECLLLGVIPICLKIHNSYELYKKYPIIWIESFNEIIDVNKNYFENYDWNKPYNDLLVENQLNNIFD